MDDAPVEAAPRRARARDGEVVEEPAALPCVRRTEAREERVEAGDVGVVERTVLVDVDEALDVLDHHRRERVR